MGVNWTGKRRRERKTRCYVEVKVAERTAEPRATAIGWGIGRLAGELDWEFGGNGGTFPFCCLLVRYQVQYISSSSSP
uniref:Uncharacterized protein n=1 Tax=Cucumis sativus TaxID=3659 RepID=A0A0A0KRI8_CUCSA